MNTVSVQCVGSHVHTRAVSPGNAACNADALRPGWWLVGEAPGAERDKSPGSLWGMCAGLAQPGTQLDLLLQACVVRS